MKTVISVVIAIVAGVVTAIKEDEGEALFNALLVCWAIGVTGVGVLVWARLGRYKRSRIEEGEQWEEVKQQARQDIEWHEVAESVHAQFN